MHPIFKQLFIDAGADDLAADDNRRRRVRRPRGPGHDHQARRPSPAEPAAAVTSALPPPDKPWIPEQPDGVRCPPHRSTAASGT